MHMTVKAELVKMTYKLQFNLKNCKYLKMLQITYYFKIIKKFKL
jgi:hypothetical protein